MNCIVCLCFQMTHCNRKRCDKSYRARQTCRLRKFRFHMEVPSNRSVFTAQQCARSLQPCWTEAAKCWSLSAEQVNTKNVPVFVQVFELHFWINRNHKKWWAFFYLYGSQSFIAAYTQDYPAGPFPGAAEHYPHLTPIFYRHILTLYSHTAAHRPLKWLLPFTMSDWNLVCNSYFLTCTTRFSHLTIPDLTALTNLGDWIEIMKL